MIHESKTIGALTGLKSSPLAAISAGGMNRTIAYAGFRPLIDNIAISEKNAMEAHSVGRFFHLICSNPKMIRVANSNIIFS
tara:strand:+ start:454 stop:696 length:243 start_codon:yes stop_codon:yes gene_type:complete